MFHGGTPRCLHNMYQQREMSYSEAMSECENLGGVLVQSTSTTDLEWMKALVNFIGLYDYNAKIATINFKLTIFGK